MQNSKVESRHNLTYILKYLTLIYLKYHVVVVRLLLT